MAQEGQKQKSNPVNPENTDTGDQHTASMKPATSAADSSTYEDDLKIDDRGTDQVEASQILKDIRDGAFDSSDEKLALALGRPTAEIEEWTSGGGPIDGDVMLKARALASERALEIE